MNLTDLLSPISQNLAYHQFADSRSLFGVNNFMDVASNLPFFFVGVYGLRCLKNKNHDPLFSSYTCMYLSVIAVTFGSMGYHLNPNNDTLVWDRLPIAIGFLLLFTLVLGELWNARFAARLLLPSIVLSSASVFYWSYTESLGRGDLRPYFLIQFGALLSVPILLLVFKKRALENRSFLWAFALYGIAKLFETKDAMIFSATGNLISGHSLKHVVAAAAVFVIAKGKKFKSSLI